LPTHRRNLKRKLLDIEKAIRSCRQPRRRRGARTRARGAGARDFGDDPRRFRRSKPFDAYLEPRAQHWRSRTSIDVSRDISKAGDGEIRHSLYEVANIMLARSKGFSGLKAWGLKIAQKRGLTRACAALAGKLSVSMHATWRDGSTLRFKVPEVQKKKQAKRAPKLLAATV